MFNIYPLRFIKHDTFKLCATYYIFTYIILSSENNSNLLQFYLHFRKIRFNHLNKRCLYCISQPYSNCSLNILFDICLMTVK